MSSWITETTFLRDRPKTEAGWLISGYMQVVNASKCFFAAAEEWRVSVKDDTGIPCAVDGQHSLGPVGA